MNDRQKLVLAMYILVIMCIIMSTIAFFAGYYTGRADQKKHAADNPGMQNIRAREEEYLITIGKLQALLGQQQTVVRYIEKEVTAIESHNGELQKTNQRIEQAAQQDISSLEKIRKAATNSYNLAGSMEVYSNNN